MASSVKFNQQAFRAAMGDIETALRRGADEGMEKAMNQAARDARRMAPWNRPGQYEKTYPSGHWEWEVTGLSAASITGYVVPRDNLPVIATHRTTSRWDGIPLEHLHPADNRVTWQNRPDPHKVIGIVTMNMAYAPYLQEWERTHHNNYPVTIEVLEVNWDRVYVPVIAKGIERRMEQVARRYT